MAILIYWNRDLLIISGQCFLVIHSLGGPGKTFGLVLVPLRMLVGMMALEPKSINYSRTNYLLCLLFKLLRPPNSSSGCLFYSHFMLDKHRHHSVGRGIRKLRSVLIFKFVTEDLRQRGFVNCGPWLF